MSRRTMRRWGLGLIGAAINSAAGAIGVVIVDPEDFNPFDGGLMKLGTVMFTLGLVGAWLYIKEHPIPLEEALEEESITRSGTGAGAVGILLVAALASSAAACASSRLLTADTRARAAVVSATLHASLAAVQDAEAAAFAGGALAADVHQRFNARLVEALEAGRAFNAAVSAWPTSGPAPANLLTIAERVGALTREVLEILPASWLRDAVLAHVTRAQAATAELVALFGGVS